METDILNKVILHTNYGEITINLFLKEAPHSCKTFLTLCKEGYYNNSKFYRIIKDFIIQTGHINQDEGNYKDEYHSRLNFKQRGMVAFANKNKPNSNTKHFFINTMPCPWLDNKNSIFGKINDDSYYNVIKISEIYCEDTKPQVLEQSYPIINYIDILNSDGKVYSSKVYNNLRIDDVDKNSISNSNKIIMNQINNSNLLSFDNDNDNEDLKFEFQSLKRTKKKLNLNQNEKRNIDSHDKDKDKDSEVPKVNNQIDYVKEEIINDNTKNEHVKEHEHNNKEASITVETNQNLNLNLNLNEENAYNSFKMKKGKWEEVKEKEKKKINFDAKTFLKESRMKYEEYNKSLKYNYNNIKEKLLGNKLFMKESNDDVITSNKAFTLDKINNL